MKIEQGDGKPRGRLQRSREMVCRRASLSRSTRILDDYQNGTISFLAPDLINAEFGNVIWKKQTFQGL